MKHRILAVLLAGMMLIACESSDQTTQTSATVTTTAAPIGTTEAPETTSAPVTTIETPVTTTAPITTETPVTEALETTAPSTMTEQPTTTDTPVTTDELVVTTTSDTPETTIDTPVTTDTPVTDAPSGTTEAPVTTTTAPITTTQAPETTAPPVTEAPVVHTHSYGSWKTTKEATCTADGTQTRTCACGAAETKTIEATGHSYGSWKTTKAATCTAEGTQTKTCADCGKTKTQSIDATGHSYGSWTVTKAATESAEGEEARTCKSCQKKETRKIAKLEHEHSYGAWTLCDDYINEEATCKTCGAKTTQIHYANRETDERLVADRIIYYINKYRAEEGDITATKLDRLTLVAEYRSDQLVGLDSSDPSSEWHSTADLNEAGTYYQYGEKLENSTYDPATGEITYLGTYFYAVPGNEAVGMNTWGAYQTIDGLAKLIASQFRDSAGHWSYVGGSEYRYIAVGVSYGLGRCYVCILVCDTDQYE